MKKIISIMVISGIFISFASDVYAGYFITNEKRACPQMISSFLTFGNSSDEVLFLQNELKREGYFRNIPDGYFDSYTVTALRIFQRDNGLLETGKIGQYTMDSLNQRICGFSSSGGSIVGTTVVDPIDPFVKIVNAESDRYVATQNSTNAYSFSSNNNLGTVPAFAVTTPATLIVPSTTTANLFYNPSVGYTYGLVPKSGSITVTSPLVNSVFKEGDIINISWYATNLNVSNYQVLLENVNTGRSKELVVTSGNDTQVVLTKEILDYVCSSVCDNYQQSNFNISIVTPFKDESGNVTNLKARIYPITIKRDIYSSSIANISSSNSPVNSNETFKLYVNISNPLQYLNYSNNYSFSISAVCLSGVSVNIAGTTCGQEFSMPQMGSSLQKEIPVKAVNSGWFTQGVVFNLSVYNEFGKLTGRASTTVQVNPLPMSF